MTGRRVFFGALMIVALAIIAALWGMQLEANRRLREQADQSRELLSRLAVLEVDNLLVSDVVVRGSVPETVRKSMELWVGCVAGALEEQEFLRLLADVGFTDAAIEPTRIYEFEDAKAFLEPAGLDVEVLAREVGGRVMGAFVRATKAVAARSCCGPECCH